MTEKPAKEPKGKGKGKGKGEEPYLTRGPIST